MYCRSQSTCNGKSESIENHNPIISVLAVIATTTTLVITEDWFSICNCTVASSLHLLECVCVGVGVCVGVCGCMWVCVCGSDVRIWSQYNLFIMEGGNGSG